MASGQGPPAEVAEPGPASRGREEKITGKLLEHGQESYRFDPHEEMSYFVRLKTATGERTIWGKDLGRAIEKSLTQPQIGDEVALLRTGADPVTVKRRERDAQGNLLKESDLATARNRWVIERREFIEEREAAAAVLRDARIGPKEAVKTHPELAGTYLNLHAAEIAAKAIRDPQDQKKFVTLVRGALAEAIARGEPLQPVRLRQEAARERSQERDSPTRS
jgi:putative DNA primase/helicase